MNDLLKAVLEEMRAVKEGESPEAWRVHDWADRLEDAIPRAVAAMHVAMEEAQKDGNAAKIREALKEAKRLLDNIDFDQDSNLDDMAAPVMASIDAALSAPPRNCDVFTDPAVGEAAFEAFCQLPECDKCPLDKVQSSCAFSWDQAEFKGDEEEKATGTEERE